MYHIQTVFGIRHQISDNFSQRNFNNMTRNIRVPNYAHSGVTLGGNPLSDSHSCDRNSNNVPHQPLLTPKQWRFQNHFQVFDVLILRKRKAVSVRQIFRSFLSVRKIVTIIFVMSVRLSVFCLSAWNNSARN